MMQWKFSFYGSWLIQREGNNIMFIAAEESLLPLLFQVIIILVRYNLELTFLSCLLHHFNYRYTYRSTWHKY